MKIHPDFDLHFQLRKIATDQTLRYIEKNMNDCLCFSHTIDVLFDYALPKISTDGLILEFGVRKGLTIKEIAKRISKRKCYGFDSFEGLPEDWSALACRPRGFRKPVLAVPESFGRWIPVG